MESAGILDFQMIGFGFAGVSHSFPQPSSVVIGLKMVRFISQLSHWKQKLFTGFIFQYLSNKRREYCGQNSNAIHFIFSIVLIGISHHNKNQIGF